MLTKGDRVRFKRPKRRPIFGTVDTIETNINQMYWSAEGTPRYIRVKLESEDGKDQYVWTTESKLVFIPTPKGN